MRKRRLLQQGSVSSRGREGTEPEGRGPAREDGSEEKDRGGLGCLGLVGSGLIRSVFGRVRERDWSDCGLDCLSDPVVYSVRFGLVCLESLLWFGLARFG